MKREFLLTWTMCGNAKRCSFEALKMKVKLAKFNLLKTPRMILMSNFISIDKSLNKKQPSKLVVPSAGLMILKYLLVIITNSLTHKMVNRTLILTTMNPNFPLLFMISPKLPRKLISRNNRKIWRLRILLRRSPPWTSLAAKRRRRPQEKELSISGVQLSTKTFVGSRKSNLFWSRRRKRRDHSNMYPYLIYQNN